MNRDDLGALLGRIDGRGYKAYKDLQGRWDFGTFLLHIDHVQGDPFAAPSRLCAEIDLDTWGFSADLFSSPLRRIALGDYLARLGPIKISSDSSAFSGVVQE